MLYYIYAYLLLMYYSLLIALLIAGAASVVEISMLIRALYSRRKFRNDILKDKNEKLIIFIQNKIQAVVDSDSYWSHWSLKRKKYISDGSYIQFLIDFENKEEKMDLLVEVPVIPEKFESFTDRIYFFPLEFEFENDFDRILKEKYDHIYIRFLAQKFIDDYHKGKSSFNVHVSIANELDAKFVEFSTWENFSIREKSRYDYSKNIHYPVIKICIKCQLDANNDEIISNFIREYTWYYGKNYLYKLFVRNSYPKLTDARLCSKNNPNGSWEVSCENVHPTDVIGCGRSEIEAIDSFVVKYHKRRNEIDSDCCSHKNSYE
jgi:hypothetical protein